MADSVGQTIPGKHGSQCDAPVVLTEPVRSRTLAGLVASKPAMYCAFMRMHWSSDVHTHSGSSGSIRTSIKEDAT